MHLSTYQLLKIIFTKGNTNTVTLPIKSFKLTFVTKYISFEIIEFLNTLYICKEENKKIKQTLISLDTYGEKRRE